MSDEAFLFRPEVELLKRLLYLGKLALLHQRRLLGLHDAVALFGAGVGGAVGSR